MKKTIVLTTLLAIMVLSIGSGVLADPGDPPAPPTIPDDPENPDDPEDPGGTTGSTGDYTPTTTKRTNEPPVIVLEWEFIEVEFGETVTLDASQCYDADGTISKIEWKGGNTVLSEDLVFEYTPKIGTQTLRLIVYDNKENTSEAEVKIRCRYVPATTAPPATTTPPETEPPVTTPAPTTAPPVESAPLVHDAEYPSVMAMLNCPAHLHAYDALGNHIGLNSEGVIENEIAGGYYSGSGYSPAGW